MISQKLLKVRVRVSHIKCLSFKKDSFEKKMIFFFIIPGIYIKDPRIPSITKILS